MKYSKVQILKEAIKHKGFLSKVPAVFRMIKLWSKGKYKANFFDILLPVLGLLYVISPIDLIPEIIVPVVGTFDDIAILAIIIPKLMKEVDKFLLWEGMQKEGLNKDGIKTIDIEPEK